ncbi:hypothetical protein B296_00009269 [Ensete ventricosum]|uniref:Uncharacterized protein n=1 Tax=Ensete ventricosum TaxID=4639 RepID=A0A427ALU4_ENSVE|nr:hypothetical protein B296_00009269 [Ensete ventricosum]
MWSGLHVHNQLSRTQSSWKTGGDCTARGVVVVKGLFPRPVVGFLQEKTFVGERERSNKVPPMAKLALWMIVSPTPFSGIRAFFSVLQEWS